MDWMAHVAFVFILCALLALKWPVFGGRNTVLVMIGALLPDIFKLYLPLRLIGVHAQDSLALFHIPVGTALVWVVCPRLRRGDPDARILVVRLRDGHALRTRRAIGPRDWGTCASVAAQLEHAAARPRATRQLARNDDSGGGCGPGGCGPRVVRVEGLGHSPGGGRGADKG